MANTPSRSRNSVRSTPSYVGTPRSRKVHAGIAVNWTLSKVMLDLDLDTLRLQGPLMRLGLEEQEKFVFAQFIVGNTYPYTQDDWLEDLKLASEREIDGFVLNVGVDEWQTDRVADCFKASEKLDANTKFQFILSFDMTSIPGYSTQDVRHLASYLFPHANHPRMFKHPRSGNVVISTVSGEKCFFGQGRLEEGWAYAKKELSLITPIDFIPSFFMNPAQYPSIPSLDGVFNRNGAWPVHLSPSLPQKLINNPKLDSDLHHLRHLGDDKTFIAAVSPWFFTHYGLESLNKNMIYRGDEWLFVRRWEQLIEMRDRIDMVQVISWNDYGESTYIGPTKETWEDESEAWVDGFPHEPWLYLNSYFARAFKDGVYPELERDQIFVWARPHPKDAIVKGDDIGKPTNWELTEDLMWIVVFAIEPATIEITTTDFFVTASNRTSSASSSSSSSSLSTSSSTFSSDAGTIINDDNNSSDSDIQILEVKPGMTKLSSPLRVGGGIKVIMVRDDDVVAECVPVGYKFEKRPGVYNFNAFTAMSR